MAGSHGSDPAGFLPLFSTSAGSAGTSSAPLVGPAWAEAAGRRHAAVAGVAARRHEAEVAAVQQREAVAGAVRPELVAAAAAVRRASEAEVVASADSPAAAVAGAWRVRSEA